MAGAGQEYGYLAITRMKGGVVKFPDGESRRFTKHSEAVSAWSAWIKENELPQALEKTKQLRKEFIDGCTIREKRIKQPGLLTPDLVRLEILDPDGHEVGGMSRGDDSEKLIRQLAEKRYAEPTVNTVGRDSDTTAEEAIVWAVGLYANGEYKSLPALTTWYFGLPIEGVLGILNELAGEGWAVAHVSEDRGLYAGTTNPTESGVTTARYMLVRSI